jgi:hypothetical protein
MDGETYVLVANGIVVPTGYTPATPFDIYVYGMGREEATSPTNTDLLVFHGSTDAPAVDVVEVYAGAGTIVDDLSYGEFSGYLELPTANYQLDIRDASGQVTVATFNAPLGDLSLQGKALTVIASGFLDPSVNNNGASFGIFAVLPAGGAFVTLGNTTGVDENEIATGLKIYPNPVRDIVNLSFDLRSSSTVSYGIYNMNGQLVSQSDMGNLSSGAQLINVDAASLPSGLYILKINAGNTISTAKIQVVD